MVLQQEVDLVLERFPTCPAEPVEQVGGYPGRPVWASCSGTPVVVADNQREAELPIRLRSGTRPERTMGRQAVGALYALALVAVVVGVDLLFFRDNPWERLAVNVSIVLVFAAFYFRFLRG